MDQRLSWEEIKRKYPDQWVALINEEGDRAIPYGAISGEVLIHDSDEDKFTQQLKGISLRNQTVDIRYTGDILPDNPVGPILWQISDIHS